MNYSKFQPLPKTDEEIAESKERQKIRNDNIQKIVNDNNLIQLERDYLDMDHYYYDKKNKKMYKLVFDKSTIPIFEVSQDFHILEINKKLIFG